MPKPVAKSSETKAETKSADYSNKETALVGLEINVKPFRKWMKEHYHNQSKSVGIINAHYIMASVDQVLMFSVLHSLSDSFKKTKSGIYDIDLEKMKTHIKITPYLNNTFYLCVDKFDENLDYQKQLCIDRKSIQSYITKYVFNDNFRINMNKDSLNFLVYLVVQSNVMLSNTALIMSEFAKKSRVNSNALIAAIKVHFSGKLLEDILTKVDCVDTLLKNKEKQDSEKGDDKEEEHDGEGEEEGDSDAEEDDKKSKKSKSSKLTKQSSKSKKTVDSDEEEADSDAEEEKKESESEEESEEEEEKPVKVSKKSSAKGPAKSKK
jgi:hypothetical protein